MDTVGELCILLLAVIAAVHVQEITSASYGDAAVAGLRGKTRRRAALVESRTSGPHIISPCPDVLLSIKNNNKTNRWYGVISITADEAVDGIDLKIQLDKPAELLGTWLGEVSTDDKIDYTISDGKMKILPGEIFAVRFFVKYDEKEAEPPNVKTISLNGRQICPLSKDLNVPLSTPEVLDLRVPAESVPVTLIASETTQPVVLDRSSSLPPQLTTPAIVSTFPPRYSRGSTNQHRTNRVQLDNSQVTSLLVYLLRRLARDRDGPGDASLTYDEVHEDSFESADGNSRVSRTENLEGLLNTVLGQLRTDKERAFGPKFTDIHYVIEPKNGDEVVTYFTSEPTEPSLLPETQEQATSVPTTPRLVTSRASSERESVLGERAFVPVSAPDAYYDEAEEGGEVVTHFTPNPTVPHRSPEIPEQTTSVPTTPRLVTSRASSERESVFGERAFVPVSAPDAYYDDEAEEGGEVVTHFTPNPTVPHRSPEIPEQATSVPTTPRLVTSRASSERESESGERPFVPEVVPDAHHVDETEEVGEVTTHSTLNPTDPSLPPEIQEHTTSVPTTVDTTETNRVSSEWGSVIGEPTFSTEVPESHHVNETEDGGEVTGVFFTSHPTDPSLSPEIQEQTTQVPFTSPVESNRVSSEEGSVGEPALLPKVPDSRHFSETDGGGEATTLYSSGQTVPSQSPETQEYTTSVPTTTSAESNRISSDGEAVKGNQGGREVAPRWTTSPCPGVFSYFRDLAGNDVWYGNLTIISDEDLVGLRVDIELDKRSQGLGALLGNVVTSNNIHYTIWNASAVIDPGESIYVYFFVKYDPEEVVPPRIKTIRLNGMQICSTKKAETSATPATASPTVLNFGGGNHSLSGDRVTLATTTNLPYQQSDMPSDEHAYISGRKNDVEEATEFLQRQQPVHTPDATTTQQAVAATTPVTPSVGVSYASVETRPPHNDEIHLETTANIVPTDAPAKKAERKNSVEEASGLIPRQQQSVYTSSTTTAELGTPEDDGTTCGQIEADQSPLANSAKGTDKQRWPWHAAIYEIRGDNLYYLCGGSLVGKRTILTAARCLNDGQSEGPFNPKSLAVYVGKYSLLRWDEAVQYREVKEIHVHPEFDSKNIHGDVAVLILASPVELSSYVQPVCLGDGKQAELSGTRREGVVVGWGFDRYGNVSDELMISRMPVLSLRTCSSRYPKLFNYALSDKIYCAGYRSRTTICSGESGDGMFFESRDHHGGDRRGVSPKWTIQGVASFTLSRKNEIGCSARNYVVFTDVTKYYDWIGKYR